MNKRERRTTDRFKPLRAITVAVKPEAAKAEVFGIVVDISEGGARLVTDTARLEVGSKVELALSFPDSHDVVQTAGKICWTRRMRWIQQYSNGPTTTLLYGIQFGPEKPAHLSSLISDVARRQEGDRTPFS